MSTLNKVYVEICEQRLKDRFPNADIVLDESDAFGLWRVHYSDGFTNFYDSYRFDPNGKMLQVASFFLEIE